MKILVTGGAGYVGTTLIRSLLDKGHSVTVLDSLIQGGDGLLECFWNPKFNFIKGDIRNKDVVTDAVKSKDVIIHLAAIVGYPACRTNPLLAESVNIDGSQLISGLCSKNQLVIYASTGSNYGAVEDVCTEDTPLNPLSLYGVTKTRAEKLLRDNNTTIAYRFATAFGVSPRMRLDLLVNDLTYKALTQGYMVIYEKHFMRTFIHVRDMARAFLFAIENCDKMAGNVYNVGSESMNFSKEQICDYIKDKTGTAVHYSDVGADADKRNYIVSYESINSLGYKTTIGIEEGIDELIRALKVIKFSTPYTNI